MPDKVNKIVKYIIPKRYFRAGHQRYVGLKNTGQEPERFGKSHDLHR